MPFSFPVRSMALLIGIAFSALTFAQQRVAFVTSVTGDADLSSWPDAGPASGLAAGDAICQARAGAAGLDNAAGFVALLSDSADDAYCRLHGLSGKIEDSCGLGTLPTDAGPWINTRGENLAEKLPLITASSYQTYRPLRYDEFGNAVDSRFFTGTGADGAVRDANDTCSDWTSTMGAGVNNGSTNATAGGLFGVGSAGCNESLPLACFEAGPGDELEPESPQGSLAFVTRETDTGNLSSWPDAGGAVGIQAGDEICQAAASAVNLPRPDGFIAWLSTDATDARDRFTYQGPWYRPDGVLVAKDLAELTSGNFNAPINLTERGDYLSNTTVWTGTTASGTAQPDTCQNWTSDSNGVDGFTGTAYRTDSFSTAFLIACDFQFARLYCIQNVDSNLIFEDGFEGVSIISDRRLKTDIVPVGKTASGIALYRFRYLSDPSTVWIGVMAQDLLESHPAAVSTSNDGYYRVNYDQLGLRMQRYRSAE